MRLQPLRSKWRTPVLCPICGKDEADGWHYSSFGRQGTSASYSVGSGTYERPARITAGTAALASAREDQEALLEFLRDFTSSVATREPASTASATPPTPATSTAA
jgi:hypothetical protein